MGKENKRPGMELNDAALENVSGGNNNYALAVNICNACYTNDRRRYGECSQHAPGLDNYMQKNGAISGYKSCPFYK